jgi:hypothetical protein
VRSRGKAIAVTGGFAAAVAVAGLAATPAAAGIAPAPPAKTPACSTDIIGRGPGEAIGRELRFSYTLAGPQCRGSLYTLIIKNTYDPKQLAIFIKIGDGKTKDVSFDQNLPWTPTGNPAAGGVAGPVVDGPGLCVIGVTTQGFSIGDIAPDPQEASCEPLRGGTARAFH